LVNISSQVQEECIKKCNNMGSNSSLENIFIMKSSNSQKYGHFLLSQIDVQYPHTNPNQ
jgi:hypothetical protein